jgi:guanine deaminase
MQGTERAGAPVTMPAGPPFTLRARLLTPLAGGGVRYLPDGRVNVDEHGRLTSVRSWEEAGGDDGGDGSAPVERDAIDVRPLLLLPGLVDTHAHLPQLPSAGLGAGLDLLSWLERYIFPLERDFDRRTAERIAPAAYRALAAAGTTTVVLYGAVYEDSLDVAFEAAEEHGIRAAIGKVMMDRLRYDDTLPDRQVLDVSLAQTERLIERWHGRDDGRLMYAVTPRFAVSCSDEMLRRSAELARATGTYWQTHLSEDRAEVDEVRRLFPEARDYVDVYERAGGLGARSIMAHAVHLSDREVDALAGSRTNIAHCPSSNLFLASGAMRLGRLLEAGLTIGLGTDVAAGPDLSLFAVMRAGAYTQSGLRTMLGETRPLLAPLDWLRLATLGGAGVLGLEGEIGSLEAGKQADMICVDPRATAPIDGQDSDDPAEIMSRLIFRSRPEMIRAAWVRGRLLPTGPAVP